MTLVKRLLVTAFLSLSFCNLSHAEPKKVGVLINGGPSPLYDQIKTIILDDFAALGYVDGRDVVIEPRFAELKLERLPGLASELVDAKVDIILALGGPASVAAQKATATTPVIFSIVTDPIALKLVSSIEKPGGNMTGITSLDPQQAAKQVELLKEAFPAAKRVAIISDQTIPGGDERGLAPIDRANEAAAKAQGIEAQIVKLKSAADVESAFADIVKGGAEVVVALEVPLVLANQAQIVEFSVKHKLPTIFPGGLSNSGAVLSYGTSVNDTWRRFAAFSDKIFKGNKASDIPVEVIAKRQLIVNLKTAKAIGISVPPAILARADRTIE